MHSYTIAINLLISIPLDCRTTSPFMLYAGKRADGDSTQLSLWKRKRAKTASSDVETFPSSISLLGQSQKAKKPLLCQVFAFFSLLNQSSHSLTKSIPSCMVVRTVTLYHPLHSGSKEAVQLSSRRRQRHSMTETRTACLWRPYAVWRHEGKHCVHAQMIGRYTSCAKKSLTPDIFTR